MVEVDEFPNWAKIVDYFENNNKVLLLNISGTGRVNYEELLNAETRQLLKLLKQM